jgi:phosphoribosylaminoimidazolecarboxamide formyltransferase/IMP cyclohydrolase
LRSGFLSRFLIFMSEQRKITRALLSVSDKTGLVEFAAALRRHGAEIISTGGTARALIDAGIEVIEISDFTGFPEMMDGRVKTLHPKVHGALLALRDNEQHQTSMAAHGIRPIDMVVVNLYPFEATITSDDVTLEEAIENIDIGGPAMIRSASKNWRDVAVVTDARLYDEIVAEMDESDSSLSLETRSRLAALAYTRTASYDLAISSYLARQLSSSDLEKLEPLNPLGHLAFIELDDESDELLDTDEQADTSDEEVFIELAKVADLRYGENPHQTAVLYREHGGEGGIVSAEQLQGKEMSYNNYVDADAAWALVNDFDERAAAIIKHTNPSGTAIGETNLDAYRRALATDPVSAFGGIVAFNRKLDGETAAAIVEVFSEVIVAPDFDQSALEVFKAKKNLRVLRVGDTSNAGREVKQISGGYLMQDRDDHKLSDSDLKIVSDKQPTASQLAAMRFAWNVCKHVKSNAIVFANEGQTLGVGAGQMNRVDSVRIAAIRAERFGLSLEGSALASDAFFPFRDNVDEAATFGVSAIIQPGGSIKDSESIEAANEHGIVMAFTGIRHFKH